MNDHHTIGAVILAGGQNRRMHGEKKLFLTRQGRSFLDLLLESFKDLLPVRLSVEEEGPYLQTGLPLILDRYRDIGPMGGICSALETCPEDAQLFTACDNPFLKRETIISLMEACRKAPDKITLVRLEGKVLPLPGIYPKRLLPRLHELIGEGRCSLRGLAYTEAVQYVDVDGSASSGININSVQEYALQVGKGPIEAEDAISLLKAAVSPVTDTEEVPLGLAIGRILAESVTAPFDQPPFPRSPLDGYALRAEDTAGASRARPVSLKVIGKIYAGQVFEGHIGPGECVRLMTGAPVPDGADTVIRQEDTDLGRDEVRIYVPQKAYGNYCPAGEDYRAGTVLLRAGTRVTSACAAVAAGTGRIRLRVFRKPAVAVISTGDEILPAGTALQPGKIYDTNLPYVTGRLTELGGTIVSGMHGADDEDLVAGTIRDLAKENDLIITTGGVSVGEKDIMHAVAEKLGGLRLFWKVRLKPGAPTLAFVTGDTLVICLTGNPYGVVANFELLVRPVLEKLTCGAVSAGIRTKRLLAEDSPKRAVVRRFLKGTEDGAFARFAEGSQASGTISAMPSCNCLIELPAGSPGKKGEEVWVHPFS